MQLYENPRVKNKDRPPFNLEFMSPHLEPVVAYHEAGRPSATPEAPYTKAEHDERPPAAKAQQADITTDRKSVV